MNYANLRKISMIVLLAVILACFFACSENTEPTNKDLYSYYVSATFLLSTEVETGTSISESDIKYHDDYSNHFANLLEDSAVSSVLEKYGLFDRKNIEVSAINDTNTMYTVKFFSNDQRTLVALGKEVCELLPELLLREYNCKITFLNVPSVDGIRKTNN